MHLEWLTKEPQKENKIRKRPSSKGSRSSRKGFRKSEKWSSASKNWKHRTAGKSSKFKKRSKVITSKHTLKGSKSGRSKASRTTELKIKTRYRSGSRHISKGATSLGEANSTSDHNKPTSVLVNTKQLDNTLRASAGQNIFKNVSLL